MSRLRVWVPLVAFAVLLALSAWALLKPEDRTIRSALVGKPLPQFTLPAALPGRPGLTTADFTRGQPRLLNIFGSWCVPCAVEAPQLMRLKAAGVPIDAIAIRDRSEDIAEFLARNGDPFARIGSDQQSSVQLSLGSSGVPETFVIDGQGVIRAQHIGDIREEHVDALIAALEAAR